MRSRIWPATLGIAGALAWEVTHMQLAVIIGVLLALLGIQFVAHLFRSADFPNPIRNFVVYALGLFGAHSGIAAMGASSWSGPAIDGLALAALAYEISQFVDGVIKLVHQDHHLIDKAAIDADLKTLEKHVESLIHAREAVNTPAANPAPKDESKLPTAPS